MAAEPDTLTLLKRTADRMFGDSYQFSVLAAGRALAAAGDRTLAKRFFLHLSESLNDKELEQLADLALRMEEPHIALLVAKAAAERGLILARSYYPVPDLVPEDLPVSRALALAFPTQAQDAGTLKLHQLWFLKHGDAANEEARIKQAVEAMHERYEALAAVFK